MRILVLGASGYIGARLVTKLLTDGHDVVSASRDPIRLTQFGWFDDVDVVELDAMDPDSVAAGFSAAGPIDVVYYLVHGIGQKNFRKDDEAAAQNVAASARDHEVGRIIYLGGFVPDGDELSEHLESRAEVGRALDIADGPDLVWLRAAVVIGAGSTSFEMVRYMSDRLAVIPLPTWIDNPLDPISVRDTIYYLAAAAFETVPAGYYDIASAETSSYSALLFAYLRASRSPRVGVVLPGVDVRLAAFLSGFVVPVPSSLASDLVRSLDHPMKASENTIRDHVPDPPGGLLTIREAVRRSVESPMPRPVDKLADVHHLADTDPSWAGGDLMRVKRGVQALVVKPVRSVAGAVVAAGTGLHKLWRIP